MGHEDLKRKSNKYNIIILGLIIHILLLFAVFDIYFATPLDHGMQSVRSTTNPPSQRLVLFVADGLRAEAVFDQNVDRIPFLRSVMDRHGSWGVAHTRVPTESRPGHVAMLAGIYEDPSAIFKGWKANPVLFDSVLNQSNNAYCWGSPDILEVFNKDNQRHIHLQTYSSNMEDFGGNDTTILDTWVFDKVEKFLKEEVGQCKTCHHFKQSGNIYFLHLLGIDTAGHGYKPHSKEYINNIKLVDQNVKQISELFDEIFKDNKTSFVFTADHGMTNWGSHGAGSTDETETPLILWGAGVKRNPTRHDIRQIDLAPLLSSLIGINIPTNSLGIIPLQFLDAPERVLAEIQLSNTLQLLSKMNKKMQKIEESTFKMKQFRNLTSTAQAHILQNFEELRYSSKYQKLISECSDLMKVLIEGIDYYHNYNKNMLLISTSVGFIGWILFLGSSILNVSKKVRTKPSSWFRKMFFVVANLAPSVLCYVLNLPLSYFIYHTFPITTFTVLLVSNRLEDLLKCFTLKKFSRSRFNCLMYAIGIELLVYGFFERMAFSVLSALIGLWILPSYSFGRYANKRDKVLWVVLCLILSIFPLFPVMKTSFNLPIYILGSTTWVLLFYEMFCRLKIQLQFSNVEIRYGVFFLQFICLLSASIYSICLELSYIANNSNIKYISWVLLLLPISLIPLTSTCISVRLIGTFFGFAPFYLLVSSNFEALFSAIYVAVLCNWLLIEMKSFSMGDSENKIYYVTFDQYLSKPRINADMFRRSFLFMVFIFIGFFGTGNIASLNSFDPMWVRGFLTVFSPFKMMGLILLKIMVPFLFSCCIFRAINAICKEDIMHMFCIVLIFSDLMVLQFLYLITNVGSWLEIGTSLSHFIIMEGFVGILLILYGLVHLLTTATYRRCI